MILIHANDLYSYSTNYSTLNTNSNDGCPHVLLHTRPFGSMCNRSPSCAAHKQAQKARMRPVNSHSHRRPASTMMGPIDRRSVFSFAVLGMPIGSKRSPMPMPLPHRLLQ